MIPFVIQVVLIYDMLTMQFSRDKRSILAVGDISEIIPDKDADIAVLEEPEHLTWFHHGKRWKTKFKLVIGIIHTNYLAYVKREKNGTLQAFLLKYLNNWVVGIYCHKVNFSFSFHKQYLCIQCLPWHTTLFFFFFWVK